MKIRHTGSFEREDEIKDMEYLAHLSAIGSDVIDQSIYAGDDWQAVHAAHARFIQALQLAYRRKWQIGREHRTP